MPLRVEVIVGKTSFFHDSLSDFDEICRLNHPHVLLYRGLLDVRVKRKPFRQVLIFWKHLGLLWFLWRDRDSERVILVREFSNVPMWLIGFGCRRQLSRLLLMNHHNLQWALHRKWNRKAMCQIQRWGANFLFFEFVPGDALRKAGLTEKGCFSIRHPVKPLRQRTEPSDHDIGFFGVWKKDADTIRIIRKALVCDVPPVILMGAPNIGEAKQDMKDIAPFITFVDTTTPECFHKSMQRCKWICLPYAKETHEYRVSGLLSDAIANQVSVLIPDYPVLRAQSEWPETTGAILTDTNLGMNSASFVPENIHIRLQSYKAHSECRSVQQLAKQIREILESITI